MSRTDVTKELFDLTGKVAVITGGAGLLGEQHAIALSDFGASIVLADINWDDCRERVEYLRSEYGMRVIGAEMDVTLRESWLKLLDRVLKEFGRTDILVNNAAFTNQSKSANFDAPFSDFPQEDWQSILNVNLTGVFLGCQVFGRYMVEEQGFGSIINMASLYGVVSPNHRLYPGTGISQPVAYSVSKAGVIALTRYLATLWADKGVRVNCITPGGIYNEHSDPFLTRFNRLVPIGHMADKSDVRGALVYLASDASAYCTGHNLIVDGGWTVW
jgi:NAD(P)-dependent dehydrogenase (short-subunit alcohol dehydrogenase family)